MTPDEEVRVLSQLAMAQLGEAPSFARALVDVRRMPYRFVLDDARHVRWSEARRRGYAACGEAAAYLAAAATREGRRVEVRIVSGHPALCGDGYRHAVVVVDGVTYDPYKRQACSAPAVVVARGRFVP